MEAGAPPRSRLDLELGRHGGEQLPSHGEPAPRLGERIARSADGRAQRLIQALDHVGADALAAVPHGELDLRRAELLGHDLDVPRLGELQRIGGEVEEHATERHGVTEAVVGGGRGSGAMPPPTSGPFGPASRDVKSCNQSGSIATRTRSMAVSAARTSAGAAAATDQLWITSDRSSSSRRWPSTERAAVSTTTSPATCCRCTPRASASTISRTSPWALPLSRSHAVTTRRAAAWSSDEGTAANRSACGAGGYELRLRLRGADSGLGLGRVVIRTGCKGAP